MRKWWVRFLVFLVLNLAACGGFATWLLTDRTLDPSGPKGVGTRTWDVVVPVDDAGIEDTPGERRLPVQAWYPAESPVGEVTEDADASVDSAPFVVFVHGAMGQRPSNVSLYRELASHGYVVVAADHLHVAMPATYPDGSVEWPSARFRESLDSGTDMLAVVAHPAFQAAVGVLRQDAAHLLDTAPDTLGIRASHRVWAGHSLGSAAALDGCRLDPGCAAIVALDSGPYGRLSIHEGKPTLSPPGQTAPLLAITSTAAWKSPGAAALLPTLQVEVDASTGGAAWLSLEESGHLDLTDVPLLVRPDLARAALGESQIGPGPHDAKMTALVRFTRLFLDATVLQRGSFDARALAAGSPLSVNALVAPVRKPDDIP